MSLKKRALKILKLAAVNLLLLFVFFEIASVAVYFFKTREFFYTRDKGRVNTTKDQLESARRLTWDDSSPIFRLHPFFGYVDRQARNQPTERQATSNNFGFRNDHDFPFRKTNNQYVIGIFGGSVAFHLAGYERQHSWLVKALQESPYFKDKEVVLLCFAIQGHKQPQQLLILNYFLSIGQQLDMVINLDGFNEIGEANLNRNGGVHISMPTTFVVGPLINLANKDLATPQLSLSLKIRDLRTRRIEALSKLAACRIATCYTLRWMQAQYLVRSLAQTTEELGALGKLESPADSLIQLNRAEKTDDSTAYDQMADLWAASSLQMKEVLSAKGIAYYHFIQPNQYYPTARKLTDGERKIAFIEGGSYHESIKKGYPKLFLKVGGLQQRGVNVFSAVNIFDDVGPTIYADTCCHYTELGNQLLSNYIARNILNSWNTKSPPR